MSRPTSPKPANRSGKRPNQRPGGLADQSIGATPTLRVAIYIRISTDEEHQPFSLEAQETRLRAYINTQPGWQLVGEPYKDEASGATTDRPHLQRALAAARAGRFDVLLVYRVDRLSRSLRSLVDILDHLETAGVVFRSATEPFDTATPVGRMLVQMLGVFAQFERETIIDRVINGMERRAAQGKWSGGRRPHGYQPDPDTGKLRPLDHEIPTVHAIFDLYVRRRIGARSVATELNRRGHRTTHDNPWNTHAVLTVLRNRVYLGEIYYRGTWYRVEDHHPALIDAELFEQAQQIMIARGEDHSRRAANNSDYLLAGLATCAHCGKRYLGNAANGRHARYRYYTCYSRIRYGTDTCDADRIPAGPLEEAIITALLDTFHRHDIIDKAVQAAATRTNSKRDDHQAEFAAIEREQASVQAKIDRYLTAFENRRLSEETCAHRIETLADTAAKLRDRRAELHDLLDTEGPTTPTGQELALLRRGIQEAIDTGEPATVKALLQALIHEIKITGRHHIQPVFRLPTTQRTLDQGSRVRETCGSVPPTGFEPALPP
jgi:site-specific DNA recombinase